MGSLYPNIDAERARAGLTLEELCSKLGISRKAFYNWLSNGKIPQRKVEELAKIFGVSVDYLLTPNSDQQIKGA